MDKSKNKEFEMLKYVLPNVNFERYEITSVEERINEEKRKSTYRMRLFVTIEEKADPPDKTWKWISHGFVEKKFNDRPLRNRALTLISRKRKRKNKTTWKVYTSKHEWVLVLEWTKKAEDLLFFLKMRK